MKEDNDIIKLNTAIVSEDTLYSHIAKLIDASRSRIAKTVNSAMVYTYYGVGQYIVEFEQGGNARAEYGKGVLKRLSARLSERYGNGWSVDTLEKSRKFFIEYSNSATLLRNLNEHKISATVSRKLDAPEIVNTVCEFHEFRLSWSHYLVLMHINNPQARSFYEIEAFKQQWSVRQLQRQIGSSLYERLALSRDKEEVMRLAKEGQTITKPSDIIKNPLVLEFVGLKADTAYSETDLEGAIISKLQEFLLEMGKGFLFEARQKRFTFEERHFYVDRKCCKYLNRKV